MSSLNDMKESDHNPKPNIMIKQIRRPKTVGKKDLISISVTFSCSVTDDIALSNVSLYLTDNH